LAKSLVSIAQIMFILAAASAFTWVLTGNGLRGPGELDHAFCGGNKYFYWIS
jgi:TRAP-type C4-dicarboxylate transport system permease large subunit